jgi:hypothetical protein
MMFVGWECMSRFPGYLGKPWLRGEKIILQSVPVNGRNIQLKMDVFCKGTK